LCSRYSIFPALARTTPEMALRSVVLPAPFGPTMVMNSPSRTSSDRPSIAWSPPYATLSPEIFNMTTPALAEIGLADNGIASDFVRRPARQPASVVQHHQAIGQANHRVHRVLDDGDRDAVDAETTDQGRHHFDAVGREPRQRLVEQHQMARWR